MLAIPSTCRLIVLSLYKYREFHHYFCHSEDRDDEKKLNAKQEEESDENDEEVDVKEQGLLSEGEDGLEGELNGDDADIEKAYGDDDDKIEAEAKQGLEGEIKDELKVQQQELPAASVEDKELDGEINEDDVKTEKVYNDDDEKIEAEDNELAYANVVRWPYGTYALPMTTRGCPPGWRTGWRYQDNEDNRNINSKSRGINSRMRVVINRNLKMYYCVKTYNGPRYPSWPRGTYCIAKKGRCPRGFRVGSVFWDDEDNRNRNSRYGTLPTGIYNRNTKIYYCCRSDGSYNTYIRLPTTRPFYLYRYGSRCQRVSGMRIYNDFIRTDDEDNRNINSCAGAHPAGSCGRNIRINFCYYSRYGYGK